MKNKRPYAISPKDFLLWSSFPTYFLILSLVISCSRKQRIDAPSIEDFEASWMYSESISPNSPTYEHDGINDFVKISMHNRSTDTLALSFQTPTKGNFFAAYEGDTLVLAVGKKMKPSSFCQMRHAF